MHYSIPPTSDYIKEISKALSSISILLLILTPEVENSAWVPSEVSSAKGAKKILLGYKPYPYNISDDFNFLFQHSQIFESYNSPNKDKQLIAIINDKLNNYHQHQA